jgi:Raf kinase inhibitor-like YbhB/YbcL family protein
VGTRSFALVMIDPDGGKGLGSVHWVAYGLEPSVTSLAEGEGGSPVKKMTGGTNTAGMTTYRGPCPPVGDQPHHYVIGIYALDLDPGALPPGLTRDALFEAIRGHSLAEASIVGRYAR